MSASRVVWGQIVVVFAIVLFAVWIATQWVAWRLGFQPQLGAPWVSLAGLPIYPPPAFFVWWFFYELGVESGLTTGTLMRKTDPYQKYAVVHCRSANRLRPCRKRWIPICNGDGAFVVPPKNRDGWSCRSLNFVCAYGDRASEFEHMPAQSWSDHDLYRGADLCHLADSHLDDVKMQQLKGSQESRIANYLKDAEIEDLADWPRQHQWLADHANALYRAIASRVSRLDPDTDEVDAEVA